MAVARQLLRLSQDTAFGEVQALADTELLRRYARERDESAFVELVRRNGPIVLRACRHVAGKPWQHSPLDRRKLSSFCVRNCAQPQSLLTWTWIAWSLHLQAASSPTGRRHRQTWRALAPMRSRERERGWLVPFRKRANGSSGFSRVTQAQTLRPTSCDASAGSLPWKR